MIIDTLAKQGREKIYTGLADIEASKLKKMRNESLRKSFASFDEIKYKLDFEARISGMDFINDAASRTVNATWYSLDTLEKSIIWIANGDVNDVDFASLKPLALQKVRMLVCLGENNQKLHETFSGVVPQIIDANTMEAALYAAFYSGIENAVTIFSPACENGVPASEQGAGFKYFVNEL